MLCKVLCDTDSQQWCKWCLIPVCFEWLWKWPGNVWWIWSLVHSKLHKVSQCCYAQDWVWRLSDSQGYSVNTVLSAKRHSAWTGFLFGFCFQLPDAEKPHYYTVLAPPKTTTTQLQQIHQQTTNHLKWLSLWWIHIKLGRSQEVRFSLRVWCKIILSLNLKKKISSLLISCSSGEMVLWCRLVHMCIMTGLAVLCDVQLL